MKRLLLILCILFISDRVAFSPKEKVIYIEKVKPVDPYEKIWEAVCIVESGKDPLAYNKKENAVGIVQIREVRITDYNNKTGNNLKLTEMYDPMRSKSVFLYYAMQIGHEKPEIIARCWNGGENGMKLKSTKKYYLKIKQKLALLSNN